MWAELSFLAAFAALAAWAIWFILAPLFERRSAGVHPPGDRTIGVEREAVVDRLAELELEYRLGQVAEEDYAMQRDELRNHVMGLLQQERERWQGLDSLVEQAVALRRKEVVPFYAGPSAAAACANCGEPLAAAALVCTCCGARAPAAATSAPPAAAATLSAPEPEPAPVAAAGPPVTTPEISSPTGPRRRPLVWAGAAGALGAVFIVAVLWLYWSSPAQAAQVPIASVPAGDYQAMLVAPAEPDTVLLGSASGLLLSVNSGKTWQPANLSGNVRTLAAQPGGPALFAAGPELLARSDDGGRTWERLSSPLSGEIRALAAGTTPGTLAAITADGALYRSPDLGATWEPAGTGAPSDTVALAVVAGQRAAYYLASSTQGVLSGDGKFWGSANGFVNGAIPTLHITALAFDPHSGDSYIPPGGGSTIEGALYAGSDSGLFKSIDGGGSWNRLPLNAPVQALAVAPNGSKLVYVVDGQGRVFRSPDRGLTWVGTP